MGCEVSRRGKAIRLKAPGRKNVARIRYIFGPDTKLKINGEFVDYKRYDSDTSDGSDGTMWVLTDLTMTPETGGLTPSEKYTSTSTTTSNENKPNAGNTTSTKIRKNSTK